MANGSFGLSGLPTAPTTVGSAPNNPLSPVVVPVISTAGFQAGDLIYNVNGDVQPIPGNYVSSATFPATSDAPISQPNVLFGEQQVPPVSQGYSYKNSSMAAKLTSGNIVIAYLGGLASNNKRPFFKIVSETGTVIVADTQVSTVTSRTTISVCALTGGGFALGWYDETNLYAYYAIYSNTGTVVLAATSNTGVSISNDTSPVGVYARPDGSWILTCVNGTQIYDIVYSATGTVVVAGANRISNINDSNWYYYVVRSDNSYVIFYLSASSVITARVLSAVGVFVTTVTLGTGNTPTQNAHWGGASLLTNGNIIVTWGRNPGVYYAQLSSANVASGNVAYATINTSALLHYFAKPFALSNGNYVVVYYPETTTSQNQVGYILNYSFFNTSNVLLSSTGASVIYSGSSGYNYLPSLVETTSALNVIWSPLGGGQSMNNGSPNVSLQVCWVKINFSTYKVIPTNSISINAGNTSAQAVSGYARGGSTPTAASFFAASTGSVIATSTQSTTAATLIVPQTTLTTATTVVGRDCICLADGSVLVVLGFQSGSLILYNISTAGVVLSTTTIATDVANNTALLSYIQLAVLSDGKIACSYVVTSTSVITILILSSTFTVLTSVVSGTAQINIGLGCNLAALTNTRFVLAWVDNQPYARVQVWSSDGTLRLSATNVDTTSADTVTCTGTRAGFYVGYSNATNYRSTFFTETSTNNWSVATVVSQSNSSASRLYGKKALTGPSGICYDMQLNTTVNATIYQQATMVSSNSTNNAVLNNVANGGTVNATSSVAMALTGFGDFVVTSWNSASTLNYFYITSGFSPGGSSATQQTITGLSLSSAVNTFNHKSCGVAGHNVFVLCPNSASATTFFVFNPNAFSNQVALTSGVTASNTVPLSAATGVALLGVSTSDAPANGSGNVQINGSAQLNSNYPITTGQSFDFKNPVTFGAAGVISGRNVTLIGNV